MLTGCASSTPFASAQINLPPLPAYVAGQGKVTKIPKGPLNEAGTKKLIIKLRQSEVNNARAVRIAKANHEYLRRLYYQQPTSGTLVWPGDRPDYRPINRRQYRGLLGGLGQDD